MLKEKLKKVSQDNYILPLSKEVYDKRAILSAAYKFLKECYIKVDSLQDREFEIDFKKNEHVSISLDDIVDKFCNELVDQQLRVDIANEYKDIRNLIIKQAFSSVK